MTSAFDMTDFRSQVVFRNVFSQKTWRISKWVFPKIGVPQNGWFIMDNPIKMDDLGVSLFRETSKSKPQKKDLQATKAELIRSFIPDAKDGKLWGWNPVVWGIFLRRM